MSWNAIVEKVTPYVIKIETPRGHGTGFLCLYNRDRSFYGIATARHVVSYADEWQQPIRLHHFPSGTSAFLKEDDRAIWADVNTDSALILCQPSDLKLPEEPIPLLPTTVALAIGTEVGWLGFPALASSTLCFFAGNISARQEFRHAYLIDGVAINGVSGGPVVYSTETDGVQIVGTISAYISNKATGDTLPGLSIARDLSHFHDSISQLRSLDEAKEKKQSPGQQKASTENPAPKNSAS
jgi:hypothetical protein